MLMRARMKEEFANMVTVCKEPGRVGGEDIGNYCVNMGCGVIRGNYHNTVGVTRKPSLFGEQQAY
jgi:hypothetical protein